MRAALRAELEKRNRESSLLAWCTAALAPIGFAPATHHRLLIRKLEEVQRGETKRLMIFMPPGSAKSTYTTELFTAWLFSTAPNLQIIGASHTSELAEDFSVKIQRHVRNNSERLGYGLASENRGRWYTTNGGAYLAAGVGGAIPGFRSDFAIIDDPIKGRSAADSEANRKSVWDWYLGDLERRMKPDGRIILMHTRWHEDDLAGRLLAVQAAKWDVLKLPALASEANDPLGRAIGEPLWADDTVYGYARELLDIRASLERAGAVREWSSQYQQEPRPAEGSIFKVTKLIVLDAPPPGALVARAWDLAATRATGTRDPDWTAGVKLMRTADGRYAVLDVVRLRGGPEEVEEAIVNTAHLDGHSVRIGLPQDPGQAGKQQVAYLTKRLAGYRVESSTETGDKATRAAPVASQANVGSLLVVRAPGAEGGAHDWLPAFIEELRGFPSGAHDDQIDALSRAFSMVSLQPKPLRFSAADLARI